MRPKVHTEPNQALRLTAPAFGFPKYEVSTGGPAPGLILENGVASDFFKSPGRRNSGSRPKVCWSKRPLRKDSGLRRTGQLKRIPALVALRTPGARLPRAGRRGMSGSFSCQSEILTSHCWKPGTHSEIGPFRRLRIEAADDYRLSLHIQRTLHSDRR